MSTISLFLFVSVLVFSCAIYVLALNKWQSMRKKWIGLLDMSATVMAASSAILFVYYVMEVI